MNSKKFQANKGKMFPLKVNGELIFITDKKPVELDMDKVCYMTKVNLIRGEQDKDIFVVENVEKKTASKGKENK